MFINANAQQYQWGEPIALEISKEQVKNIIHNYVDTQYPLKVKEYNQKLDELKKQKIEKVSDKVFVLSNLMWQDNDATLEKMNILEARIYCRKLELASRDDWRLPTYKELLYLVDYSKYDSVALDGLSTFSSQKYFSNSVNSKDKKTYWYVDFMDGTTGILPKQERHNIRCVREISNKRGKY